MLAASVGSMYLWNIDPTTAETVVKIVETVVLLALGWFTKWLKDRMKSNA